VRLDEDARLALVGFAEVVAGVEGCGDAGVEIGGLADAFAVAADAAVIGKAAGFAAWLGGVEAVDELGEHERESVFAGSAGPGEDDRLWDALVLDAFAQALDGARVAEKLLEAHVIEATRKRAGSLWMPRAVTAMR